MLVRGPQTNLGLVLARDQVRDRTGEMVPNSGADQGGNEVALATRHVGRA